MRFKCKNTISFDKQFEERGRGTIEASRNEIVLQERKERKRQKN